MISILFWILVLFVACILNYCLKKENNRMTIVFSTLFLLALIGLYGFVVITCIWNVYSIPKILLLLTVGLLFTFADYDNIVGSTPVILIIGATVISYMIAGIMYSLNIDTSPEPHVEISTYNLVSATDDTSLTGSVSGSLFFQNGYLDEEPIYRYYYQTEDGNIEQGKISIDDTDIYPIGDGETPRLEEITTTEYSSINYNNNPPTHKTKSTTTTYKLYVPEDSIPNLYEFDAK